MNEFDTIVAPATAAARSALAVVRIDGRDAASILRALTGERELPAARHAHYCVVRDAEGHPIDECVAVRFEAPRSFTGNDLVEVTTHGSPVVVGLVVERCVKLGARIAEPGEFSERALLNGRIDLVQAESIHDLINARTALQARLALANLEGELSRVAEGLRGTLLDVISRAEARLDFTEEGYEFIDRAEMETRLRSADQALRSLNETFRRGRASQECLSAVILGRPNAGKSTLLNRLVGSERAIVTPTPGTTRDIVRETLEVGGLPVSLADTAGLRFSEDEVEAIGIARAREAARQAHIIIYLVASDEGLNEDDERELQALGREDVLVVHTKSDLASPREGALAISARTGAGVEQLLLQLDEMVRRQFVAHEGSLVNERQRAAVVAAIDAVSAARASLASGLDEQFIVVDLYRAADALRSLTGAITRDDVLSEIFSRFCIGK